MTIEYEYEQFSEKVSKCKCKKMLNWTAYFHKESRACFRVSDKEVYFYST